MQPPPKDVSRVICMCLFFDVLCFGYCTCYSSYSPCKLWSTRCENLASAYILPRFIHASVLLQWVISLLKLLQPFPHPQRPQSKVICYLVCIHLLHSRIKFSCITGCVSVMVNGSLYKYFRIIFKIDAAIVIKLHACRKTQQGFSSKSRGRCAP